MKDLYQMILLSWNIFTLHGREYKLMNMVGGAPNVLGEVIILNNSVFLLTRTAHRKMSKAKLFLILCVP